MTSYNKYYSKIFINFSALLMFAQFSVVNFLNLGLFNNARFSGNGGMGTVTYISVG